MITSRNTNTMMCPAYEYIKNYGIREDSRNGPVLSIPTPTVLQYTRPQEKVNFCPVRNANPFFHFFEALWMLEALGDVAFITEFVPRMAEYSDNGMGFNAHYGRNARHLFRKDQLKEVARILQLDPQSRQALVQLWNVNDLGAVTKDRACNTQLMFRVVNSRLDMTVCNRSNDAIWGGVSGANITNLFIFQEYIAALAGILVGNTFVMSNNLHMYMDNPQTQLLLDKYTGHTIEGGGYLCEDPYTQRKVSATGMITYPNLFDDENDNFLRTVRCSPYPKDRKYKNEYLSDTATPMIHVFRLYKNAGAEVALAHTSRIEASDWRLAVNNWLERKL